MTVRPRYCTSARPAVTPLRYRLRFAFVDNRYVLSCHTVPRLQLLRSIALYTATLPS
jgi:hypothetical protein